MGPAFAERTYLEWGRHLRGQAIHRYSERATNPDWTQLDLGVRYTTAIYDRKTIFRANVQNVTGTACRAQRGLIRTLLRHDSAPDTRRSVLALGSKFYADTAPYRRSLEPFFFSLTTAHSYTLYDVRHHSWQPRALWTRLCLPVRRMHHPTLSAKPLVLRAKSGSGLR